MKKNLLFIIIAFSFVVLSGLGWYFWKTTKGIWPAIGLPRSDIADLIDAQNGDLPPSAITPAENNTEFPLSLPDGFAISVFARGLDRVRVIVNGPDSGLLATLIGEGKVVVLPDRDGDGKTDGSTTILSGLNNPHGLFLKCADNSQCRLYVAETDAVSIYDYDPRAMAATNRQEIMDLPDDGGHFTRTLASKTINGEEKLLVSVGSSCNVCLENDSRRASIIISDLDGQNQKTYARGLRNSVFMAEHPETGDIWATDNGRDWLGDDLPPDEINIIKENGNYGWPICYGQNIHDDEFDKNTYIRNPCLEPFETPAHIDLPAHSAALGIDFFGPDWPEEYRLDALVAFHGSWNRTDPTGYKIARLKLDEAGNFLGLEDFISGWLADEGAALGRPVAILVRGSEIFISDDKAGIIYRVIYKNR